MKDWSLRRSVSMPRRKRRAFTAEFKAQVVIELLTGRQSQAELCREHQLSPSLLALWKTTFLERLPLLFHDDQRLSQERARIADLEQLVGRLALELEISKKALGLLPGLTGRNGRSS
jgi:transposase-like protein